MDNNNIPRLQLRSHKVLFATREEAINYLDREAKFDSNGLFGEPVLLFYGDIDKPNMLLVIGSTIPEIEGVQQGGSNSYFVMDGAEAGVAAAKLVDKIINAVGLVKKTENRIDPDVEYEPQNELIEDCNTVAEAIEVLADNVGDLGYGYTADNEGHNVEVIVDNTARTISANAKFLEVNTENINGREDAPITVNVVADEDGKGVNISATLAYDRKSLSVVDGVLKTAAPTVVDKAIYDAVNNELVITFDNGNTVRIPISGLIDEFAADNQGHNVEIALTEGEGGLTMFSADVKRSVGTPQDGNLIENAGDGIIVKSSSVKAIADESAQAVAGTIGDEMDNKLALKSDKTYVDERLEEKADTSALDAAYAYLNERKAEKQDVERALDTKASLSDIEGVLDGVSYEGTSLRFTKKNTGGTTDIDLSNLIDDYNLRPATSDTLGGVIVEDGSGLVLDGDGKLGVDDTFINTEIESAISELAGDGLKFDENNKLAINIDAHEKYISTELDGTLHTDGIDEAIDAATDGFVDGVTYDTNTHVINITKKGAEGNTIDLSDLVNETQDIPVATSDNIGGVKIGNGIDIANDGTISVNGEYLTQSEVVQHISDHGQDEAPVSKSAVLEYMEAIQEGLDIDGIQEAIQGKADKTYVDDKLALKADANTVYTKTEVDTALQGKVGSEEFNSFAAETETALGNKADSATTYTKTEVDNALQGKQDTLTFDNTPTENSTNPVTSGGVYGALAGKADAADAVYTAGDGLNLNNKEFSVRLRTNDPYIRLIDGELESYGISDALAGKVNTADMTTAISAKADKTYVDDKISDVNTALVGKANAADVTVALNTKANIADVETALAGKQDLLTPSNTVSIATENNLTKANVILSGTNGNIIVSTEEGLFSNVDVDVDTATNELVVTVNGNKTRKSLPGGSLIDSITYNPQTRELELVYSDAGGTTHNVDVYVGDLVNVIEVDNGVVGSENNVTLTLTPAADPSDRTQKLSAELDADSIVDHTPGNAISVNDNRLYVEDCSSRIADLESEIVDLKGQIRDLTELVNGMSSSTAEYERRIGALEDYVSNRMLDLNDVNADGVVDENDGLGDF